MAPVPDNGVSVDEDGNFGVSFGVLGPGDLMGTTVDRCWEERSSGSGRRFGVGCPAAAEEEVFRSVSVSAAKVSADDSGGGELVESSDDAVDLLLTESEDGDLDFLGLGAGTGGLLARAPAGRSITRSGVCPGVLTLVSERCSQKSRLPLKPTFSPRSSSLLGELCVLRSHSSFLRTNAEICSTSTSGSLSTFLLPQLFCLRRTPSSSTTDLPDLGVTVGVCTDLGLAPVSWLLRRTSTSSIESFRPIPSLDPAGLVANSMTVSSSGVR